MTFIYEKKKKKKKKKTVRVLPIVSCENAHLNFSVYG